MSSKAEDSQPPSHALTLTASTAEYLVAEAVRYWRNSASNNNASESETPSSSASSSRIAALGEEVGAALAELLTSRKKPPLSSQIEIVKWVCKDFWSAVFSKPIDNLKTNHKGTFVLRDTSFRWTKRVSQNVYGGVERVPGSVLCAEYLALPEALVKGALKAFGLDATVKAETTAGTTAPGQVDFTLVMIEGGATVAAVDGISNATTATTATTATHASNASNAANATNATTAANGHDGGKGAATAQVAG